MATDDDDYGYGTIGRALGGLATNSIRLPTVSIPKDHRLADTMYDRLMDAIAAFEKDLKADEEVGAMLTNFGQTTRIHIHRLGYHNPGLIKIHGTNANGERCTLLQHMSQVNILLVAMKAETTPARRIGFRADGAADDP